ncbi:MAG: DUF6448 family protein [Acidobacteriota bacterium]
MQTNTRWSTIGAPVAVFLVALLAFAARGSAHCDTTQGPVVAAAKIALERADITPVLKWLKPENEPEVRLAFQHTLEVRALSPRARELADRYFFETLVRVHRAGEGAPYVGLKDEAPEPIIQATDSALATASAEALVKTVSTAVADGIRDRFARAQKTRETADRSVAQGREYVEAYVALTHYVERLYGDATASGAHQNPDAAAAHEHR